MMIRYLIIASMLFSCSEVFANDKNIVGFDTISVIDFKKGWEEDGSEPLKFPPRTGNSMIVAKVVDHSPADEAGLMKLDIIRVVNGTLIRDQDQAKGLFDSAIASGELELSVVRSSVLDGTKSRRSRLNKRTAWEYKTIKIKPVSKAEFISNCMERKVDDVREIAFIKHRDSPDYVNTAEGFHLYYSAKNGKASQMFLRISYLAGDWLFIKRYIIKTDKNTYTITPKEVSRDNGILNSGSRVWEWCDYPVDESHYEMIRDIAKSKSVTVRYDGTEYYKDFEPDQEKRDRLTAVLESYLLDSQ